MQIQLDDIINNALRARAAVCEVHQGTTGERNVDDNQAQNSEGLQKAKSFLKPQKSFVNSRTSSVFINGNLSSSNSNLLLRRVFGSVSCLTTIRYYLTDREIQAFEVILKMLTVKFDTAVKRDGWSIQSFQKGSKSSTTNIIQKLEKYKQERQQFLENLVNRSSLKQQVAKLRREMIILKLSQMEKNYGETLRKEFWKERLEFVDLSLVNNSMTIESYIQMNNTLRTALEKQTSLALSSLASSEIQRMKAFEEIEASTFSFLNDVLISPPAETEEEVRRNSNASINKNKNNSPQTLNSNLSLLEIENLFDRKLVEIKGKFDRDIHKVFEIGFSNTVVGDNVNNNNAITISNSRQLWKERVLEYNNEAVESMKGFVEYINEAVDRCMNKAQTNYENKLIHIKNAFTETHEIVENEDEKAKLNFIEMTKTNLKLKRSEKLAVISKIAYKLQLDGLQNIQDNYNKMKFSRSNSLDYEMDSNFSN